MRLLSLEVFYVVAGILLLGVALGLALDRTQPKRFGSALFWGVLAITFMAGKALPPVVTGYLALALVLLAATNRLGGPTESEASPPERAAAAERLKNWIFVPALLIPATAVLGTLVLSKLHVGDVWLFSPVNVPVVSICLGAVVAVAAGLLLTRAPARTPVQEGGRLLQTVGWAVILPQFLAALGGIFAQAGVGAVVADLVARLFPMQFPFVAVLAYCAGMALFTICMGNAFAAFPVITLGVGLPFVVQAHHGNVAIMAAIGMLSGYCGTLVTPMAANFNLVPAMLLELKDKNAVIKAQAPVALGVWTFNVLLMYLCVYRF
ncbi:MAG TPA: DUF979 domain-containing protein [Lacunisphaera sp.]|jgi:uncharacterized membrane protein|nr:DUF979 domain-containing protein [Lacunisphaera sp.]